jgi:hypothetical protein
MSRKKAEIGTKPIIESTKEESPVLVKKEASAPMKDQYIATSVIRTEDGDIPPGEIVDLDDAEIRTLRKIGAIELVKD